MSPALRLEIIDALMQQWIDATAPAWFRARDVEAKDNVKAWSTMKHNARAFFESTLDMVMPVAERRIIDKAREVALKSVIAPATEKEAEAARKRAAVHGFADALDRFVAGRISPSRIAATLGAG